MFPRTFLRLNSSMAIASKTVRTSCSTFQLANASKLPVAKSSWNHTVQSPICTISTFASSQPSPQQECTGGVRTFSSRRGGKSKAKVEPPMLSNEALVSVLIKKFPHAKGPNDIQIRLVIDEGPEQPATVQVCSLSEAIEISLDRMVDLLGTAIDQDPPVVRAASQSKLAYQKEQAASAQKSSQKSKGKKGFRFRAGIDDHDLMRKIEDLIKTLEGGTECEYTVFSKARLLRENPTAGMDLVDRIQELVSHCGILKRKPSANETGSNIRVLLEPKKK